MKYFFNLLLTDIQYYHGQIFTAFVRNLDNNEKLFLKRKYITICYTNLAM